MDVEDQDVCPICLDEMKMPYKLPCGHKLHYLCIKEAYEKHNQSCPLCRAPISADVYDQAVIDEDVVFGDYTWYYSGKSDGWWAYDEDYQEILEDAYNDFLDDPTKNKITLRILGKDYIVDFKSMRQSLGRNVRKIKRDVDIDEDFVKGVAGMRVKQDS